MLSPLPIGNALKVFLAPPASAVLWRVLRTEGTSFVDENDASATVVYQGTQKYLVDAADLQNGVTYTYGAFFFDGTAWTPSPVVSGAPAAAYDDQSTDVLSVVRDRLQAGLDNEILRRTLFPQEGVIDVLNAPPAFEDTRWPVVTVHVTTDGSGDRAIGEEFTDTEFDPATGLWDETNGWLARVHLTVVGWSKNPDERIALRQALRRLVIGNLPVFDSYGMVQIDWQQTDEDVMSGYPVPVFQTVGSFTCMAPAVIRSTFGSVAGVSSQIDPLSPESSA